MISTACADTSLGFSVYFITAFVELDQHPNVQAYYDRIWARPGFRKCIPEGQTKALEWLLPRLGPKMSFKKPVAVAGTLQQWMEGNYRGLRNEATRSAFIEFIPGLIDGLAHAEDPDDAVAAFDRFVARERGLLGFVPRTRGADAHDHRGQEHDPRCDAHSALHWKSRFRKASAEMTRSAVA